MLVSLLKVIGTEDTRTIVILLCAFIKESLEWKTPQLGHTGVFIKESLELRTQELGHIGVFIKDHWN